MTDSMLLNDVTNWHERYLVRQENSDHLLRLERDVHFHELALRQGYYLPPRPDPKAGLAKIRAAKQRIARVDWNADWQGLSDEADALLAKAVDAGLAGINIGIPGEEAFNYVRDMRAGRTGRGHFPLAALVESGRVVRPTMGRCVKCGIARLMSELDEFRSFTSAEIVYVCRGRKDPPNRLDLGPWLRWFESWGGPCSDPEVAPEPATVD